MTRITVDGRPVEITNLESIKKKILSAVAFQVQKAVRDNIDALRLVDTTNLRQSIKVGDVTSEEAIVESDADYSFYIEYGTMEFGEQYAPNRFPDKPVKKKDMPKEMRKKYPRGMNPFAPFRRVVFNKQQMEQIFANAVKSLK